jgi:hypothetical protein
VFLSLLRLLAAASLTVLASLSAFAGPSGQPQEQAQSQSSAQQPQAQPASESKPASDLVPAPKTDAAKAKKPKKVWTEDEMGKLDSKVSVVGGDTAGGKNSNYSGPKNDAADSYRNRLAPLRRQIDDLNNEIQQMRNAKGSPRENIDSQVQIREAKRAKIQEQINEIEEEARRHGIEPGLLR